MSAARGWISGLGFYSAHQLAGAYVIADGDILYPPTSILLFLPFIVLPAFMFWVVPAITVCWVVMHHHPAPWTWPLMALCLAYPPTTVKIVHGNPLMWATMVIGLGTLYGWPAIFVVLKPTLAPFGVIGIRTKRWWFAAAGVVVVSALFGSLWVQYFTAIVHSRNPAGVLYSMSDVPTVLIPLIAWFGRDLTTAG